MPQNINNFATKTGDHGVGLEPTIQLDEEQNYINHLHQLRRVNGGSDSTDMAGYGLYLLRMPITLMPGPASRKGKGAIVTLEARHELTDELLENTLRDVVVLDATYALTEVINEELHKHICLKCASAKKKTDDHHANPAGHGNTGRNAVARALPNINGIEGDDCDDEEEDDVLDAEQRSLVSGLKTGAGPNSVRLQDLRIILGSTCWPEPLHRAEGDDDAGAEDDDNRPNRDKGVEDGKDAGAKDNKGNPNDAKNDAQGSNISVPTSMIPGRAQPRDHIIARNEVIRTKYQNLPGNRPGLRTTLPIALRGPNNRLRLLYSAINERSRTRTGTTRPHSRCCERLSLTRTFSCTQT